MTYRTLQARVDAAAARARALDELDTTRLDTLWTLLTGFRPGTYHRHSVRALPWTVDKATSQVHRALHAPIPVCVDTFGCGHWDNPPVASALAVLCYDALDATRIPALDAAIAATEDSDGLPVTLERGKTALLLRTTALVPTVHGYAHTTALEDLVWAPAQILAAMGDDHVAAIGHLLGTLADLALDGRGPCAPDPDRHPASERWAPPLAVLDLDAEQAQAATLLAGGWTDTLPGLITAATGVAA